DASKNRLFEHNHRDHPVELDPRPIQEVGVKNFPRVGLVTACFPCTDLSLAGGRKGIEAGPQSSSFLRFADMLDRQKKKRPPFVILENVVALIHSHGGKDFRIVLERLAGAGYRVDALKVDARHFVPQSRPRLFIVGVRDDVEMGPHCSAEELEGPDELRPERLYGFMQANADLPWAIRPLPELPTLDCRLEDVLEDIPEGDKAWWSEPRLKKLRGQVSDRHRAKLEATITEHGVAWATGFRRMRHGRSMAELRFDGLAGCLRTPKGGSAKQILVRADREGWRARLLSPRECARLMGADDFRLDIPGLRDHEAYFGFGDAVCVSAVTWLAQNYINPIATELIRGRLLGLED
ncbi:MAG: DNA cytosine methyltransferase, partial [Planctomycetota bacterium]